MAEFELPDDEIPISILIQVDERRPGVPATVSDIDESAGLSGQPEGLLEEIMTIGHEHLLDRHPIIACFLSRLGT